MARHPADNSVIFAGPRMRRLGTALAVVAALAATPAFAQDVSGFYVGIYGGAAQRTATQQKIDYGNYAVITSPAGPVKTVTDFADDGKIDPLLLQWLERGVQTVDYPYYATPVSLSVLTQSTLTYGTGKLAGFVIGYDFGGVRVDADVSDAAFATANYHENSARLEAASGITDGFTGKWNWFEFSDTPTTPSKEDTIEDALLLKVTSDVQFFLVDGYWDIDTGTAFTPYLGGGIGAARVSTTMSDLCTCSSHDPNGVNTVSTIVPAAQLGGGVRIALAKPVTLDIGYRYRVAPNPRFKMFEVAPFATPFQGFSGVAMQQSSGIIAMQTVTAGLTFALQ